ncbi:hypothetical protein GEMRC1_006007 [Eukaryota sp. GEM-RC1]
MNSEKFLLMYFCLLCAVYCLNLNYSGFMLLSDTYTSYCSDNSLPSSTFIFDLFANFSDSLHFDHPSLNEDHLVSAILSLTTYFAGLPASYPRPYLYSLSFSSVPLEETTLTSLQTLLELLQERGGFSSFSLSDTSIPLSHFSTFLHLLSGCKITTLCLESAKLTSSYFTTLSQSLPKFSLLRVLKLGNLSPHPLQHKHLGTSIEQRTSYGVIRKLLQTCLSVSQFSAVTVTSESPNHNLIPSSFISLLVSAISQLEFLEIFSLSNVPIKDSSVLECLQSLITKPSIISIELLPMIPIKESLISEIKTMLKSIEVSVSVNLGICTVSKSNEKIKSFKSVRTPKKSLEFSRPKISFPVVLDLLNLQ